MGYKESTQHIHTVAEHIELGELAEERWLAYLKIVKYYDCIDDVRLDPEWLPKGVDFIAWKGDSCIRYEVKGDSHVHRTHQIVYEDMEKVEHGKPGWARTSKADILCIYCPPRKLFYIIEMRHFRLMVGQNWHDLDTFEAKHANYTTIGKIVPLQILDHKRIGENELTLHSRLRIREEERC